MASVTALRSFVLGLLLERARTREELEVLAQAERACKYDVAARLVGSALRELAKEKLVAKRVDDGFWFSRVGTANPENPS